MPDMDQTLINWAQIKENLKVNKKERGINQIIWEENERETVC